MKEKTKYNLAKAVTLGGVITAVYGGIEIGVSFADSHYSNEVATTLKDAQDTLSVGPSVQISDGSKVAVTAPLNERAFIAEDQVAQATKEMKQYSLDTAELPALHNVLIDLLSQNSDIDTDKGTIFKAAYDVQQDGNNQATKDRHRGYALLGVGLGSALMASRRIRNRNS